MNEPEDKPVRYMAAHYTNEIIKQSAAMLLEMSRQRTDDLQLEYRMTEIERALKLIRFNLQKPPQ